MPEKFEGGIPSPEPEKERENKEGARKIFRKIMDLSKKRHDAYLECSHWIHGNFTDDMIGEMRECQKCTQKYAEDAPLIPEIVAAAKTIDENQIKTAEDVDEVLEQLHYQNSESFFDDYLDFDSDWKNEGSEIGSDNYKQYLIEYTKEIVKGIKNRKPETFGSKLCKEALELIEEDAPDKNLD